MQTMSLNLEHEIRNSLHLMLTLVSYMGLGQNLNLHRMLFMKQQLEYTWQQLLT